MRNRRNLLLTALVALSLLSIDHFSFANGKSDSKPQKEQSNGVTNSSDSRKSNPNAAENSDPNKGNPNTTKNSDSNKSPNREKGPSSDTSEAEVAKAKPTKNNKLRPLQIEAAEINGKAEKAKEVRSRAASECRGTTSTAKARIASDPCSDFIVVFEPGFKKENSREILKQSSAQVKREFSSIFNGALVTGPLSKMIALSKNPNVLVVEDDLEVKTTSLQSGAPWGLDRIDQRTMPLSGNFDDLDQMGANTYSFVVDTGIDATNQDFEGRVSAGFTAIADGRGSRDCNGHGTHVAGIIGGKTYGVAKKTTLVPVRVLDCNGSGSYSSVISGLDWIAANYRSGDAAVVNLSLGGPASSTLDGAVRNLISKGISVVVAAGNSNADACNFSPARAIDAITVGATDSDDSRAPYSNFGSCLDGFAPGSAVASTWIGEVGVNTISGTSMAAPHVAGALARFLANNSGLSPLLVAQSFRNSATLEIVKNAGILSPNRFLFLEIKPESTLTSPVDSSPTFKKTNPRGKK